MKRLETVQSLLLPCGVFADIGTDHGLLAAYMTSLAQKVIAADISEKCLSKAKKLLADAENVEFVACDGLKGIASAPDTIALCGMGGHTIIDILSDARLVSGQWKPVLVIQPQTKTLLVRRHLESLGYEITDDLTAFEDGRYYDVIRAERCSGKSCGNRGVKMPKVKDVIAVLRAFAPEEKYYDKEYDNVGLLIGHSNADVKNVLCCLDVTQEVIAEAVEKRVQLIVCHHPLIYMPIKSVTDSDPAGAKALRLIENGIAVYAAHTNLDFVKGGINDFAAESLGLTDIRPLEPYISAGEGFGRVGALERAVTATELRERVKKAFDDAYVTLTGDVDRDLKRIAVINGGGGGEIKYVDMALAAGADCLITGDVKHHVALYALDRGIALIETQHYSIEHCYIPRLVKVIEDGGLKIGVFQSMKESRIKN